MLNIFRYVWHLYLSAFFTQAESQRSKILANTFRIVQAFTCSLPLIILNFYTLLEILQVEGRESEALNIKQLTEHLGEGINGNCPFSPCLNFGFSFVLKLLLWKDVSKICERQKIKFLNIPKFLLEKLIFLLYF